MIKDLRNLLQQVHEPDSFLLSEHDGAHPTYHIFKLADARFKDLDLKLRPIRKEHARFDIFINGQYILEKDYLFEQFGKDFLVKFKKSNFPYSLSSSDEILSHRKNKFLKIGRQKGFIENIEDLSSLKQRSKDLNQIIKSKKIVFISVALIFLGLISLLLL